ncbi:MAG: glycosyl hydrolase [Bacilli bacterium]|nr:glycosyl hydrolase [Bacilli bacterium]MBN2877886.1 glycosyl hydrolase [Bacilli bacterium]
MMKDFKYGRAICYSGYRAGQNPAIKSYPSYDEIKEDLLILEKKFDYIRLYDPSQHAKTVLEVIQNENIDLKVMLGIDLRGEISNPECAWGGIYTEEQIKDNIQTNEDNLQEQIRLAQAYPNIIFAVSAGNEAVPEWNENLVSPKRVLYFVNQLKANTNQLVTYCENNHYWTSILQEVAEAVDLISIHTYPVWIGKGIDEGLETAINDFEMIARFYPHKRCIITETGWTTKSNGRGIVPEHASVAFQERFVKEITEWADKNQVLTFLFEAFDEPWKGASNPDEPEKHWGIYDLYRQPKFTLE